MFESGVARAELAQHMAGMPGYKLPMTQMLCGENLSLERPNA
jgi:hypothetical protein